MMYLDLSNLFSHLMSSILWAPDGYQYHYVMSSMCPISPVSIYTYYPFYLSICLTLRCTDWGSGQLSLTTRCHGYIIGGNNNGDQDASLRVEMGNIN